MQITSVAQIWEMMITLGKWGENFLKTGKIYGGQVFRKCLGLSSYFITQKADESKDYFLDTAHKNQALLGNGPCTKLRQF